MASQGFSELASATMNDPEEATTRLTIAVYLDDDGEQQRVEIPGWVGAMQGLADHLRATGKGLSSTLGQLYMERPYADLADAPDVMTVVDLRSNDGKDRMVQEFVGAIEDQHVLTRLLRRRLGPLAAQWTPKESTIMQRPRR